MVENLNLSSLQHMSDDDWLHMFVSLYKLQHLTTLNLRNNDFTKVSKMQASPNYRICFQISSFSLFPEVEILNFSFCNLTFEQTENIFVKSALSKRIKTLILKNIDCSKVPKILLKSGTENLTTLDISQEFFESIWDKPLCLKFLPDGEGRINFIQPKLVTVPSDKFSM